MSFKFNFLFLNLFFKPFKVLDLLMDAGTLEGYEEFLIIEYLLYNLEFLRLNSLVFFDLKKC